MRVDSPEEANLTGSNVALASCVMAHVPRTPALLRSQPLNPPRKFSVPIRAVHAYRSVGLENI